MNTTMVTIVDYGVGNVGSVENMLRKLGQRTTTTSDPAALKDAHKLILPGVGAFDEGMSLLSSKGLVQPLRTAVQERGVPILGICLGMQMLARTSEEGSMPGLGLINAQVRKFQLDTTGRNLRVPHMGWDYVRCTRPSFLTAGFDASTRFYFVHSYYVTCERTQDVVLCAEHGHEFVAGFEKDNVLGVQFHPEKSHKYGLQILRNFIERY